MELLDVLDENGNLTGMTEERKVVHQKGLWHKHAGVMIMNKKGEIVFQQRAMVKKVNPGKWTRTGGHVDSGETAVEGVQRETYEEIGVKIPLENFKLINVEKREAGKSFVYSYIAVVDYKIEDYKLQKEEVMDIKYLTIEQIEKLYNEKDQNYTFIHWNDMEEILKLLRQTRKEILE